MKQHIRVIETRLKELHKEYEAAIVENRKMKLAGQTLCDYLRLLASGKEATSVERACIQDALRTFGRLR